MIDVKKIFNSNTVTITVYVYSQLNYSITVNSVDIGPSNSITVPKTQEEVVFLVTYENSTTETFHCSVNDTIKEYSFMLSYVLPVNKEHIFIASYVKKYFQGWATAGSTSHSSVSKIISPLLLSLFNREMELIIDKAIEGVPHFPISKDSVVRADSTGMAISEIAMIPFSHLTNIEEEPVLVSILKTAYGKGDEILIGNENRREKIKGDEQYTYSSKLKYGKNNQVQKTTNDFVNNQDFRSFIFSDNLPIKISSVGTYIHISNENATLSYQASIPVEKCIVTPFGDVFILSLGKIYYAKTEITPIELTKTNPSINNNNIVEIDGDFFSP